MTLILLGIAAIAAICILACLLGDDTVTVQPEPDPTECDVLVCTHEGWVPVTWRCDGASGVVCHGHYDEGFARGWWS